MKIRTVGVEFHADGQIYMTKLIVPFRHFANAPNNTNERLLYLHFGVPDSNGLVLLSVSPLA